METSKSPRSWKHHSRSRSQSRDKKRKSGEKKHRRSRSRSKEARRRDQDKMVRSHSRSEDLLHSSDKERERLSEDSGEERHRRKDKRSSRARSQSRSRSRERRHHSRSRDRRRSLSRSRERQSKSHERKRRPKSQSRSRSKHRQRSKSRSKSREKKKRIEKMRKKSLSRSASPVAFRGRNTAMDAQEALARRSMKLLDAASTMLNQRLERARKLQEQKEKELLEKHHQQQDIVAAATVPLLCDKAPAAASSPALNVAALLASGTQVTPQIAMAAQMAALQAKTLAETGIAVPSYYNPSAVNPMKFAEQEKKRKLLWQGKREGVRERDKSQTAELWEKLNFGNKDQNVKFRKLMGIKADEVLTSGDLNEEGMKTLQQQEEMFRNLDVQYEMARSQTHTQRGMGLGFSTSFSSRGMDPV
ncbi:arginine/serine-rich coiled-coil protein 2 isoform X2 [Tachysurus vachellii]|uniref:arginine/serine-rich coiled-coil protein 2 isoform X2 n=1 Tax=Tachysurus vachellii TaxID=175792 RepID=UPI00296B50D9|nr:arginine/serine-rich coiled-coil protein 2 isoform X2 [Tachysurus vachellii]